MSVNSKMTAIADKIRVLLGISGAMGLDAMAKNLATEQTNVTNAFTAIGNKGGTVPTSKVSGNLASAINSIPSGVTIQEKSGTVTTKSSSSATTVNCGFKPDVVFLTMNETYNSQKCNAATNFNVSGGGATALGMWSSNSTYLLYTIGINQTSTGFTITAYRYNTDWGGGYAAKTFTYHALKYTA